MPSKNPRRRHSRLLISDKFRTAAAGVAVGVVLLSCLETVRAGLFVYESFNYAAGSALTGATGDLGFSSAYTSASSGLNVANGGSKYGDLSVLGNKLAFSGSTNNGNFGVFANSPHAPGSTVYVSYLMQVDPNSGYAGVSFFQGSDEVLFTGKRSGTTNVFGIEPKVGAGAANSTRYCTRLSMVVYRIDFAENSAMVRMYVNPQSDTEPAQADLTVNTTTALVYDRVRFQSNNATGSVDEFRMGDTFADVAPLSYGSNPQEIVVLGSSVAAGTGASTQSEAWAYRFKNLMENLAPIVPDSHVAWTISNASVGGDNTSRVLARYQNDVSTPRAGANTVIISLSLANEGLVGATNPQAIYDSFKNGMTEIIRRCRADGFYPVVTLCYPNGGYTAEQYGYVRKMNLLLNTWDVPCINFLGAIDDGNGHWPTGYVFDDYHPNSAGHLELYTSVVPSLFDAIAAGKTATPKWDGTKGYLRLQRDDSTNSPLVYSPAYAMRSFTMSFRVRTTELGTIASIGSGTTGSSLEIRSNTLAYVSPSGTTTEVAATLADGRWHDIAISRRGPVTQTLLFVDGQLKSTITGPQNPATFTLGGNAGIAGRAPAPVQADYQDAGIYRAAWTQDEARAQSDGALQQGSLEVLATLDDSNPAQGTAMANKAQSFGALTLQSPAFTTLTASTAPDGLSVASYATTTASLTWADHASGSAAFTVERRRVGVAEAWTVIATTPAGVTSYEDSSLTPGTVYEYRVSVPENGLQGDYSNVASVDPSGKDSTSYQTWITSHFPAPQSGNSTYLIDFNTNPAPNYGGVVWNTVASMSSPTPVALKDTNNQASGMSVAITDSFDQFRSDNGSPLTGYAADAQATQFALRDDSPLKGAITFTGLDPASTYDFTFFARRGSLVSGFHYVGTYTFTGNGAPVVVTTDAANNTALTQVPPVQPDASGTVTLTITAGQGTGTPFPVINFIKFSKSVPSVYLIDFNTNAAPVYGGLKWNTVSSLNSPTPYALKDRYGNTSPYTVAVTDSFDQFRSDNGSPLADYAPAAQATNFGLRDDNPLKGVITFGGLDPAKQYNFTFFARRGSLVAGYHYVGNYSFSGDGDPVVVTTDAANNTALTSVAPIKPNASGVVTLTVTAGQGTGTPFPVINFIQFQPVTVSGDYSATIDPLADPDGDGMSNLEEYARGFDPSVANAAAPLQVANLKLGSARDKTQFEITRDRRTSSVNYVVQFSTDLVTWETDATAVSSVISSTGALQTVRYESPLAGPLRFYRIQLVQVP